jgi:hypothetical protein
MAILCHRWLRVACERIFAGREEVFTIDHTDSKTVFADVFFSAKPAPFSFMYLYYVHLRLTSKLSLSMLNG